MFCCRLLPCLLYPVTSPSTTSSRQHDEEFVIVAFPVEYNGVLFNIFKFCLGEVLIVYKYFIVVVEYQKLLFCCKQVYKLNFIICYFRYKAFVIKVK